jgi:hypothetical protein
MPKKPPALCMFCGSVPCTCDGSPTPVKQKSSAGPRVRPSPVVQPTGDGSLNFGEIPKRERVFKVAKAPERDLSYESALRVLLLSDILHPESEALVRAELSPPKSQSTEQRVHDWRKRNGLVD